MMITIFLFVFLACFCSVWNVTIIFLVIVIIIIRLCVAFICYRKFSSILALIWVLGYLGGIIVCFVYVSFLTTTDRNIPKKIRKPTELNSYLVVFLFILMVCKVIIIKSSNLYELQFVRWRASSIIFRETYSQIISQSPLFFFITAFILLYGLLQVLSMLNMKNKASSYYLL